MSIIGAAGRRPLPREARRTRQMLVRWREAEFADLSAIANDWGAGPAEVVWALVSDLLARFRSTRPDLSGTDMAILAARVLMRHERPDDREATGDKSYVAGDDDRKPEPCPTVTT